MAFQGNIIFRESKMSDKCYTLHQLFNRLNKLNFPFDVANIPLNGIYVLFEKGESAHKTERIVRIGSHTGDNQLQSRLKQHFINKNKDRSIFRKNIGRAMLNKNRDTFLKEWELDLTTKKQKEKYSSLIDFDKQKEMEKTVSKYIQDNFAFVVFQVDDKNNRLELESKIISTISLCNECKPSNKWLGLFSTKDKIRESGLWLVNELYKESLSDNDMQQLSVLLKKKL